MAIFELIDDERSMFIGGLDRDEVDRLEAEMQVAGHENAQIVKVGDAAVQAAIMQHEASKLSDPEQ